MECVSPKGLLSRRSSCCPCGQPSATSSEEQPSGPKPLEPKLRPALRPGDGALHFTTLIEHPWGWRVWSPSQAAYPLTWPAIFAEEEKGKGGEVAEARGDKPKMSKLNALSKRRGGHRLLCAARLRVCACVPSRPALPCV